MASTHFTDPNLCNIYKSNLRQINRGQTNTAVRQAQDYLNWILYNRPEQAQEELNKFVETINHFKEFTR